MIAYFLSQEIYGLFYLFTKEYPRTDSFSITDEFYQIVKEDIIWDIQNLLKELTEGTLPNSDNGVSTTQIPSQRNGLHRNKNAEQCYLWKQTQTES